MANVKITELPTITTVKSADLIPVVDTSGTPTTSNVTVAQFVTNSNGIIATISGSNFTGPVLASGGLGSTAVGNELNVIHSGSPIVSYDAYLNAREDKAVELTTVGSPDKAIVEFSSGTNGKTYGVDCVITAQSTTTTGSLFAKFSGHYFMVGGTMTAVASTPYTLLNSNNHAFLVASLTTVGPNVIVSGSQGASTEEFRWGCFMRVQEQGS